MRRVNSVGLSTCRALLVMALAQGALVPLTALSDSPVELETLVVRFSKQRFTQPQVLFSEGLVSNDYVEVDAFGRDGDEASIVASFQRAAKTPNAFVVDPARVTVDEVEVRRFGDTAVVNARLLLRGKRGEAPLTVPTRATFTCMRHSGKWQILGAHFSNIVTAQTRRLLTFDRLPAPKEILNLPWHLLLEDPEGDGRRPTSADGKSFSYAYDSVEDMLWFRLELHGTVNLESPAMSVSIDADANQNTGRAWYGSNSKFIYDKILNLGVLASIDSSKVQGYNGVTTDKGAEINDWLDHKKGNLTFYVDEATKAYFLGVSRTDIDASLRKFNVIASVGSEAFWNDDIGNEGFATIELEARDEKNNRTTPGLADAVIVPVSGGLGLGSNNDPEQRMKAPRLYRVVLPVTDIEQAAHYYTQLLGIEGRRVSPGRHYFDCGGVILALYNPEADGDDTVPRPNLEPIYLAVRDLEAVHERARRVGGLSGELGDGGLPMREIQVRPWGERSFYLQDPFGNPLSFVDEETLFTGS